MRCRGNVILVLALFVGGFGVGASAQNAPADLARAAFEAERNKLQTHFLGLPPLDASRLDEVLQLRSENGRLAYDAPVMARVDYPQRQFCAKLAELGDGVTVVSLGKNQLSRGTEIEEVQVFSLAHYDLSKPDAIGTIQIQCRPEMLRIEQAVRHADNTGRIVEIIELPKPMNAAGGRFQLTVKSQTNGAPGKVVTLAAPDFQTFLRRHPAESRKELRPLLRRIGQERVLAPDPLVAWQVFADRWRNDSHMEVEIGATLASLGSPTFRARDAAVSHLIKLGRPAAAALLHRDRTRLTPEQNARIDEVLRPYSQLTRAEAAVLRHDVDFLLDCLYADDDALRAVALNELRELTRQDLHFEPAADAGARVENVRSLRRAVESWARG